MEKNDKKPVMKTNSQEVIKQLAKIRSGKGHRKLNKLGEWLSGNPEPLFTWDEKDLKYILR